MRRLDEPPPEVRALVADRLQYVLGPAGPRRSRGQPPDVGDDPDPADDALDGDPAPRPARQFARVHLAVVTVLVLVGLLGAGWALFRARPVAVASPGVAVTASTAAPPGDTSGSTPVAASAASARPEIVVHVVGAVRRPGLVRIIEGARVQDALDAAGGLTRAARPGWLNLAQLLSDGQQIVIGTADEPASEVRDGSAPPGASAGSTAATTVDLNRATAAELEQLPGVGPVTAAAILSWRSEHGRFTAITELQQVDGIGPKTYAQIAPHVRV
ncbi:MAG TPA: helix-hairpin-helix domain-containing protein [Propionibacteriaceae bacterium]|nr:helix-hairpin-helix domain-containing protein [Propionibacteriaceae bacterium]